MHLAPDLVRASHPGVVSERRSRKCDRYDRTPRRPLLRRGFEGHVGAGSRYARHLVLFGTLVVLHAWLARPDARPQDLPPYVGTRDWLRHYFLLGRPYDPHVGIPSRPSAIQTSVSTRSRARRSGPQDVEELGQHHRPTHHDREVWCRRHAPLARYRRTAGQRPQARRESRARLQTLRQQALEHYSFRARERRCVVAERSAYRGR